MDSKYYAYISTALYVVILFGVFYWGKIEIQPKERQSSDIIYIEMVKPTPPPPPKPQPQPTPKSTETMRRENIAPQDNSQQVSGKAEETRTVNQRALFKMSKDGTDKPANAGNKYAKRDTVTKAAGTGGGLNPIGTEALDAGLQGRGLISSLPQPIYPEGNKGGKVVVRVAVNQSGYVTEAAFEPKGSTTSDKSLVDAAVAAARKARFTESKAFVQGGRITYVFRME